MTDYLLYFTYIILSAHIPQNDTFCFVRGKRANSVIDWILLVEHSEKTDKRLGRKHFITFGDLTVVNCCGYKKRATHDKNVNNHEFNLPV